MPRRPTLLAVLVLTACAGPLRDWDPLSYRVRPGDTLYSIAWRYQLDYRELARINGIEPPYLIYPGQRLRLVAGPVEEAAATPPVAAAPVRREAAPARSASPAASPPAPAERRQAPAAPSPPPAAAAPRFQWPLRGALLRRFDGRKDGALGIDIAARAGDPVRAAAAGTVVYSGSGLPAYGKLVIIRHDDTFLSAYAYNRALHVVEGQTVAAGEVIAEVGDPGDGRPRLHFEIRVDGKPVDPLRHLPPP
ncbi:MAG: peptidase [Gammaproteobacteria bacterium]|nr:MAG: peptidase [Gammaproteobacteria bacterium]